MAEHDLTFDPISPNKKQRKNKSVKSKSGGRKSVDSATTPEAADVVVSMVPVSRTQFRVVVELEGDKFIDEINPFKSANRTSLINKLADRWPTCCKESFLHLHDLLPDKANETLADIEAEASARQQEESTASAGANDSAKILEETPKELIDAAKQFLNNPALFDELREDFGAIGIVGEEELATTTYVTGTSRIMDEPLGEIVQAASSSGKSYVTNCVVGLMPPEQVFEATAVTANAWYYMEQDSLRHKFVCIAERKHADSAADASTANDGLALREMLSKGVLIKRVTITGKDGIPRTMTITQRGPIAFLATTTEEEILEEDQNRLLQLTTDESQEQTVRIMAEQARKAAGKAVDEAVQNVIRQKHQTAQRLLQPLKVIIPYAELLAIPSEKVTARRAFSQLLRCIAVVALLRQFQKKQVNGVIKASITDYRYAYEIMYPVLKRAFAPVNERALELYEAIRTNVDALSRRFDRGNCREWCPVSRTEIRKRLAILLDEGLISQTESAHQGKKAVYLVERLDEKPRSKLRGMLSPVMLRSRFKSTICQKATAETESLASGSWDGAPIADSDDEE